MDDTRSDEILVQITCKLSQDNQRHGYLADLMNDAKPQNFNKQLHFNKDESGDKIFNDVVEDLNLAALYLSGCDVTIVKYGKKNVFYEEDLNTDKTDECTSSSEDSDDSESDEDFHGGLVQKFIRTIFEELVSVKDLNYIFSIGWTEISERNQLLDLLNGNGLVQCYSMSQLLDALTIGLNNRNSVSNHNILSIVLEQQWMNPATQQPQMKLSTANFCDLDFDTDRAALNNFISEPRELPMNFYGHPNSQLPPYAFMMPPPNGNYFSPPPVPPEFGFFNGNNIRNTSFDPSSLLAQQQSNKLLKNAEILFSKLNLNDMNDDQRKEIQEWMYLKTECDSISATPELPPSYFGNINAYMNSPPQQLQNQQPTSLLPIIEMDETNDPDENETNDNDSDCGSYIDINDQSNNLFSKISDKMTKFRDKTDELVQNKSKEYFDNNPQVLSSGQSDVKSNDLLDEAAGGLDLKMTVNTSMSEQEYLAKSGRRRSVRDANVLNSEEMDLIRKAAAATSLDSEILTENVVEEQMTKLDELRKALNKSLASIVATNKKIEEIELTIALKKKLIIEKEENKKTRLSATSNCNKKKKKYQADLEKKEKDLNRAVINRKTPDEILRLRQVISELREKLKVLNGINKITAESSTQEELKTLKKSLAQSRKTLEKFHRDLKSEMKHKESIEKDIAKKMKMVEANKDNKLVAASPCPSSITGSKVSCNKVKIRDVQARLGCLDEILKEKSSNLKIFGVSGSPEDKRDGKLKDSLRYEIRNLRRTRDTLVDQLVELRDKFKRGKMLTDKENRQLMVCDESIHAIDDVIEAKNEMICGHKSIDTDERTARERGEKLLMARLNKLSHEEMRILLYKYFSKVIDMKESCKKLELEMQRMREAYEWHVKTSTRNIQMERLEKETNLVVQRMYYENKINLLLRNLGSETASSSVNDSYDTGSPSGVVALPAYEDLNVVQGRKSSHRYQRELHHQTENENDMKSLFARIQLHRIQGASSSRTEAQKENLKLKEKKSATTLKREGKKLVIQTD